LDLAQHHRIAGHAADLRLAADGGQQFVAMRGRRRIALPVRGAAPPREERLDRCVGQRVDAGLVEGGQDRCADVRDRAAGDDVAAVPVGPGDVADQPGHLLPHAPIGRFVQPVQQHGAGAVGQLLLEEPRVQAPGGGGAGRSQVMGQPGRGVLAARRVGRVRRPFDVLGQFVDPHVHREGAVADSQPLVGRVRHVAQPGLAQGKRDAAQERGLARPRLAHHHQPIAAQRRVQRNLPPCIVGQTVRAVSAASLARPTAGHIFRSPRHGASRGQRDVQILDRKAVRPLGTDLQSADVDPSGFVQHVPQVLGGIGRRRGAGRRRLQHVQRPAQVLGDLILKAVVAAADARVAADRAERFELVAQATNLAVGFELGPVYARLVVEVELDPRRSHRLPAVPSLAEHVFPCAVVESG